jgi:cytochrome P450
LKVDLSELDMGRVRQLFDLRLRDSYRDDPHPAYHELRQSGPVHEGVVHRLIGWDGDAVFDGLPNPDRPHFSAFGFEACQRALRDQPTFSSSPNPEVPKRGKPGLDNSILRMTGPEHRRYRSLVQPSFVPAKAKWWIQNWIDDTVNGLIDGFESDGRCELNIDFCAAIPVLTITGSFGVPVQHALDIREAMGTNTYDKVIDPIIAERRERPQDDLISVLLQAELHDEDGSVHRLSDEEINAFSFLLLAAGSGTTWKQMGITLMALLTRPALLDTVRADPSMLRAAIEESVRWCCTDPMFSRYVTRDIAYFGTEIPAGAVMHLCLGAANHDPARWESPDEYDLSRPLQPALGFGDGSHVCLGMHVARAEMVTALEALFRRLPGLRLDPDTEPPGIVGMYERGPSEINVVWDG